MVFIFSLDFLETAFASAREATEVVGQCIAGVVCESTLVQDEVKDVVQLRFLWDMAD